METKWGHPMAHQMYSKYWVTYRNSSKQQIANAKIRSQHFLLGPPQYNCTDDSNNEAGKSSTCTCTSHAKYFTKWTSSTQCTCPQATTAGSEAQRLGSLKESPAPTQWQDFCDRLALTKQEIVTLLWLL